MSKIDLAKQCLNGMLNASKKEELYVFFTKDTAFFDIENEKNISIDEMIEKIQKYRMLPIRWLESNVSYKAVLENNDMICHIYFEVKRNRVSRIEFASKI